MATAEIKRHWNKVAEVGCIITHSPNPTLHHIHSGSCTEIIGLGGVALKTNDWLVIPLVGWLHVGGPQAIDGCIGVLSWEEKWETQVNLMDELCRRMNMNIWAKANITREVDLDGHA